MRSYRDSAPSDAFFKLIGYEPYPYQRAIHDNWSIYRTAIVGRQSGKSQLASVEAAFEVLMNIGSTGWVVSPTYDQASIIFERVAEYVRIGDEQLPGRRKIRISNRLMRINIDHYDDNGRFLGSTRFQGKSSDNEDNLRGASLNYLIIDEAAMIEESVWFAALAPTLTTTNGWVLIITTPKGFNWVHEFFRLGQHEEPPQGIPLYTSWQLPTWEANPSVPQEFFDQQKLMLPERTYRQEFGAEFISDSGSVFQGIDDVPKVTVKKETDTTLYIEEPSPMYRYVIGADFARLDDFSVFTVVNVDKRRVARVLRINTVSWERQLAYLVQLSKEYRKALVYADGTGLGDVLLEQLASAGIPFEPVKWGGTREKEAFINKLALSIEHKRIQLPDNKEYLDEFRNFQYDKTRSGQLRMRAGGKGKDDRVTSLALAWSDVDEFSAAKLEVPDDGYTVALDDLDLFEDISTIFD